MVSRSLTEVFVLMRNNAIHSRQIFAEQGNESERVRLMRSSSHDLEAGLETRSDCHAPPPWSDSLEEAHYIITRLRTKISELQARHEQQIRRPALDDSGEQQHIERLSAEIGRHFAQAHARLTAIKAQVRHGEYDVLQVHHEQQIRRPALDDSGEQQHIERLSAEIGRHFAQAHARLTAIKAQVRHGSKSEQKLATNVVLALVTILQELSVTFRSAQSNYLKSLTSREERSNAYFDLPNFEELSLQDELLPGLTSNQTDLLFSLPSTSTQNNFEEETSEGTFQKQNLNQKQLLMMQEENTKMVAEREEEVNKIVKSIVDLNDIFKDLAQMVNEQGTVLDRIDYNIEQTQVQVHEGYKQLQKAERYQRQNRKMHCIMILAVTVIVMVILLIIVKS